MLVFALDQSRMIHSFPLYMSILNYLKKFVTTAYISNRFAGLFFTVSLKSHRGVALENDARTIFVNLIFPTRKILVEWPIPQPKCSVDKQLIIRF